MAEEHIYAELEMSIHTCTLLNAPGNGALLTRSGGFAQKPEILTRSDLREMP